jgi:hypothetical protein
MHWKIFPHGDKRKFCNNCLIRFTWF